VQIWITVDCRASMLMFNDKEIKQTLTTSKFFHLNYSHTDMIIVFIPITLLYILMNLFV